ncbi:SAF domain-containing protein [Tessaracoccus sp. OS52]|uniref:SAF domain-containing protein n=1 Tax=Tessaracoccus sp. OS52 TaxID=2886691 RepID=UPI001D116939|nr:SAF domain-containing protein [Tessaracoccus sp. OS52]MCC2593874.1 SAF domain-containing protein [Tessaracoccus sp. OS52]
MRPRRSPRLVALGVLLVVLGALGAAALYTLSVDQESAVVMSRDVIRGQELAAEDLRIISVPAGFQVDRIHPDTMPELIGKTALNDLPAGAFPSSRHLGETPIPADHSLVGLQLGPGRMPGTQLVPRMKVQLVSLAEGDATVTDALVAQAPELTDDGTGFVIDVVVPDAAAHAVARLAATQQLALVAVGED